MLRIHNMDNVLNHLKYILESSDKIIYLFLDSTGLGVCDLSFRITDDELTGRGHVQRVEK